ncbi:MAG: hypothetical protein AOA65_2280 [Candidatus Bathyarchaeota archaeon BA1]|nr:MAG: hypothetical protein AOA65_2280 [Candidatus Bathyarchaeota archaeon BA1]
MIRKVNITFHVSDMKRSVTFYENVDATCRALKDKG